MFGRREPGRHRRPEGALRPIDGTRMKMTRKGIFVYAGDRLIMQRLHADTITWMYSGEGLFTDVDGVSPPAAD